MPRRITVYDLKDDGRPLSMWSLAAEEACANDPKRYSLQKPKRGAAKPAANPAPAPVEEDDVTAALLLDDEPAVDDLTVIKGIGDRYAKALAEYGVTTFAQLAVMPDDDVERLDKAERIHGGITRDRWREQAAEIVRRASPDAELDAEPPVDADAETRPV